MNEIFGIDKFNIIADEDNYYFFRALNNGDSKDIENGVTVENGIITSIRTDRDRYIENLENSETRYSADEPISLLQAFDHIKTHNRKDTNCISLSSNANVSLNYGRENYSDQYVIIKMPKNEIGKLVFNAGEYMLSEIEKRIEEVISSLSSDDPILEQIQKIDNAMSKNELIKVIEQEWKAKTSINTTESQMKTGIVYKEPNTRIGTFQLLNAEQSLAKDKIMQKLALLERKGRMAPIIPNALTDDKKENASSRLLAQTIGSAFSSCEFIHYGEIINEHIINVQKEIVDIFALLQQMSESKNVSQELVEDLKQDILSYIKSGKSLNLNDIENIDIDAKPKNDISIEEMFELTGGSVSYGVAENSIKKVFYLAKARLRANAISQLIERITENNPKYLEVISEIKRAGKVIEPEIITRKSNKGTRISESVNLDIRKTEKKVISEIEECSTDELLEIVKNGGATNSRNILQKSFSDEEFSEDVQIYNDEENNEMIDEAELKKSVDETKKEVMSKEEYYARSIMELYNFNEIGITGFKSYEKQNFIERLIKLNCDKIYKEIERLNITKAEIAKMVLNIVLRKDLYEEYSSTHSENIAEFIEKRSDELKRKLSISAIESFLGYYSIQNTDIVLKEYQKTAVQKSDEIFKEKRFASVILPTGSGKTFVSLVEMLKHKNEPILYLAPTNEILEQVKNDIINYCHGMKETVGKNREEIIKEVFQNLVLSTYCALGESRQGKDIIKGKYDFIVLDELHRTGAEEWEKSLDELLNNQQEETKVLGITATPKRDIDGKDMADETALKLGYSIEEVKEDKHIAINIDLFTAIELGMVVNPKLIFCEYNLLKNGSMESLLRSINEIDDENVRKEKLAKFKELRTRLENADGIKEILRNGLKKGGKYIVFLPVTGNEDIEDEDGNPIIRDKKQNPQIKKYRKMLNEYINENGLNPRFCSMLGYYGNQKNKEQLEAFENSKKDETTFLLVLNKANEGLHIKGITGMLWFRPLDENSYILYMQQLGRVITAEDSLNPTKSEDRPVVFDFANNTFNLNFAKRLKEPNEVSDFNLLSAVVDWIKNHGDIIPNIDSSNRQEAKYAATLNRIQAKYIKFVENKEKYSQLEDDKKEKVDSIIKKGMEINLWNIELPKKTKKEVDKILEIEEFSINGIMKDFIDLKESIILEDRTQKSLRIVRALVKNGVDVRSLKPSKLIDGKIHFFKISELNQDGIDFLKIIRENGINGNITWARVREYIKESYYGLGSLNELTEDEKKEVLDIFGENFFRRTKNINLELLRCLAKNEVDIKSIIKNGQKSKKLIDIKQDGINIEKIFEREGFSDCMNKTLTDIEKALRNAYNGIKGHLEDSEIFEVCEILGEDFFEPEENINIIRLKYLIENGVDIHKIIKEHTTNKNISELEQEGVDFRALSKELDLDNKTLGYIIFKIKFAYKGKRGNLETDDREFVESIFGKEFFEETKDESVYLKTIRVLMENGIDIRNLQKSVIIDGKKHRLKIKDIQHQGIDKIIEENELNGNKTLQDALKLLKRAYHGIGKEQALTEEERRVAEELLGREFFERNLNSDDIGQATLDANVYECDEAQRMLNGILEKTVEQVANTKGDE